MLVAPGWSGTRAVADYIEIIDLLSSRRICGRFPDFPHQVTDCGAGLFLNGTPILCGARNPRFRDSCRIFKHGKWMQSSKLTIESSNFAIITLPNGELLLTGGATKSSQPGIPAVALKRTDILSAEGIWKNTFIDLPIRLSYHCMVLVNKSYPMVIGGSDEPGPKSKKTFTLSFTDKTWNEGPPLQSPRKSHTCSTIRMSKNSSQESIIVAGGSADTSFSDLNVEILDEGSKYWRLGPRLPHPIYGAAIVKHPDGGVVLIGGHLPNGTASKTLYYLPDASSEAFWVQLPQTLFHGRSFHAAVLVPDDIIENCYDDKMKRSHVEA